MSDDGLGLRTIIYYGRSGLGKTTEAVRFARLMYEMFLRPVLLVSAESSSRAHFQPLIDLGVVRSVWLSAIGVLPALRRLRRGLWPHHVSDGKIGWSPVDWKAVDAPCAMVIEGLSSISDLMMESQRREGVLPPSRESDKGQFELDGERFQCASQRNYGIAQDELLWSLAEIDKLPLVGQVLWTSHEYAGEEEDTHRTILGPQLAGRAKTETVPRYCGMLLHVEGYPERVELPTGQQDSHGNAITLPAERIRRRVWFTQHLDPQSRVMFPAKLTIPPEKLPEMYAKHPGGFYEPGIAYGTGLDKFLRFEMALRGQQTQEYEAWKARVDLSISKGVNSDG